MTDTAPPAPLPAAPVSWPRRIGSVLLFIIVAGLGFEVIPMTVALLLKFQAAPTLFETPEGLQYMRDWLFGTGTWIWLASVPGALGYFFTPPGQRVWLLLAPIYVPLLYALGALVYFTIAI